MDSVTVGPDDNLFEVLGHSPEEAANLLVRSKLVGELRQFIREKDMSLRKAADFFGTTHSRINDLMQGRIDKFGIDYLINLLARTGKRVTIHVEDPAGA